MKTALYAGFISVIVNLVILSVFVPLSIGFRPLIVFPIVFWTLFATAGAMVTMILLRRFSPYPRHLFAILAVIVFLLSFFPIYLHMGVLREFPLYISAVAVLAVSLMHIIDSLIITGFVIALMEGRSASDFQPVTLLFGTNTVLPAQQD